MHLLYKGDISSRFSEILKATSFEFLQNSEEMFIDYDFHQQTCRPTYTGI